jgi:hypothetical protein
MRRALLPSILISFGFMMVGLATTMPLFEWRISEMATDFPPTYEVHISIYPLTTKLGESLDEDSYIGKVYVSKDGEICYYKYLNFVANLSQNAEALEQVSLQVNEKYIQWLEGWIAGEFLLSGIYIWWFTIWYKHHLWKAVVSTTLAVFIFLNHANCETFYVARRGSAV